MVRVHPGLLKMDSDLQARYDAGVQFRNRLAGFVKSVVAGIQQAQFR
jgi:hypothetical protein